MLSRMMPTVSSICAWMAAVFAVPLFPPAGVTYGSYGSDIIGVVTEQRDSKLVLFSGQGGGGDDCGACDAGKHNENTASDSRGAVRAQTGKT
ncbi:hypothetical protein B0H17DRAFT_1038082 [Mycena rosella]|uniref:Uncharacterized protein n=1 Tax=Mycena rosella TaxID=1033263 RepID=A0AAD7GUB9_MYCRO|nr:hypothetical protein B0H17DRAFT_1038082 [Mycena rosella]